ncbi:MAG: RNase adapter RapZ [Lachnospiraceae bacterium]|nr:RNase adapter RapZ [Lachnospiraceae bacterium]
MKFVIVTGMSGGGKRTAMKMFEDMGFYCVDNLPAELIGTFADLITQNGEIGQVALGMDIRSGHSFTFIDDALKQLENGGITPEILFMEAEDPVLIKRYKESRRVHPIKADSIEECIAKERKILAKLKKRADYVIDTTTLLTRELKEELEKIFMDNADYNSLMVQVMSFGFKHGIPLDADLVLDVRFLPNPFYVDELKTKTGLDKEVQDYVLGFSEAHAFLDKTLDLLRFLIPNYIKEGKTRLVICVGCTGGKHRSITLAQEIYKRLQVDANYGLTIFHRDVGRPGK